MKTCPHCAEPVRDAARTTRRWWRAGIAIAVVALVAAIWAAHATVLLARLASVAEPVSIRRIAERDVPRAEAFAPLYRRHMILSLRCHVGEGGLIAAYASLINRAASREILAEIEAFDQGEAERARGATEYDSIGPTSPECRDLPARIDTLKDAMDAFPQ